MEKVANKAVPTMSAGGLDKDRVGKAIGRIASGVFIMTTQDERGRDGIMASWVSQAAFEPPMVTVAVKKERHVLEFLKSGSKFSLNVLSKKNMDVFKAFVKPFTPGMDRFEGIDVSPDSKAGPIISSCVAYLDCMVRSIVEAGDHTVVVAEIIDGDILNAEEPMIHLRSNGFQY
jgi:flavin reductase (DIM6/NTAB) family NADH-FMN oxidoreductase RutF